VFHTSLLVRPSWCFCQVTMALAPPYRVQVWFEISCNGLYRDNWHVALSGHVLDTDSVQEALAQVCTQRSASSFECQAQQLLIEHFIRSEESVRIEILNQGIMIRLQWHSIIRLFTNRTYFINFENVTGVTFNIQDIPESP
jgi:hypothetical protein